MHDHRGVDAAKEALGRVGIFRDDRVRMAGRVCGDEGHRLRKVFHNANGQHGVQVFLVPVCIRRFADTLIGGLRTRIAPEAAFRHCVEKARE